MRLPAVSRMHFIECGANTGMEWGNVAVPTVQYTHGMLSCCEFTGVPLSTLLDDCGFDRKNGQVRARRGRRRLRHDAHHRHGARARRRDGGLGDERRDAAPRERLPAAARGARAAGRFVGQVAAAHRGGRPAVGHQGRVAALRRPDARRHASPVHLDPGVQVGHHVAFGRADPARQGLPQRDRPRVVGTRARQARRRVLRRRAQLEDRAPRGPGACPSASRASTSTGSWDGEPRDPAVARHRRHRVRAAEDQPAARGARHALDLPQQRDPVVARRRRAGR